MSMRLGPVAGLDYPESFAQFRSWFATDADCLDYLEWLRWPSGFSCPDCGGPGWRMSDGRFRCAGCGLRVSVTAGTLFDHRRTPLTVWFELCWRFAASKQGLSALEAMRDLGIGSYRTAWGMLHRIRRALVRPGRERLSGRVEVDETYVGGVERGLPGGRARGKKSLVGVAVEMTPAGRLGRARLAVIPDASAVSLGRFVRENVEPGSTVITDAWHGYTAAAMAGYGHEVVNEAASLREGADRDATLPGVHRAASLVKRWLLATHQGAVSGEHLQDYLDEWVFRFNRRSSRRRGLLFYRLMRLAVDHEPVRYADLIAVRGDDTGRRRPAPRGSGGHPPSLDCAREDRPWRQARG